MLPAVALSQGTLNLIRDNGPADKRLNIVILSEGYTFSESALFDADAAALAGQLLDSTVPYSEYESYFNVFSIFIASNESGSDHPSDGIYKDTYFNSTYDSYQIERLITIPPNDYDPDFNHGQGKLYDLLIDLFPEYDIVLLLVNDSQYGGSGGDFAISSVNVSAPEIVRHELGHSFGTLADEYEDITPGFEGYESPNTTAETTRELIKWTGWILPSTPVPTPETSNWQDFVGLFEGACYEPYGWYRPELYCKMRSLGPDFCEVCKQQLIISQYMRLSPIESYSPLATTIQISEIDTVTLAVTPLVPTSHDLSVQWYLDDEPIPGAVSSDYLVEQSAICGGVHVVRAEVVDTTSRVRTDPLNLLTASHDWTIECATVCGDADGSAAVDIDDVVYLIAYIFTGGPAPVASSDVDCSGGTDIDDVVYLIAYIFSDGPAPCDPDGNAVLDC